ncbi:MAG: AAA family ATPase [Acidobacteria bacterium]|nr:AAA family ATPase [Acidobacteriota bacterium]MCA1651007.1 AAA family ATPase [Acidobacteriota bacterium]
MDTTTPTPPSHIAAVADQVALGRARILAEIRKVIVGQDEVIDQVLMALFTGGHCLITGVPGLAKTLLIKTVAQILDLSFKRIQFTPDLMPADITGTEVLDEAGGHRSLRFVKGPIFAQILLADEINRTPPKTQAALLEAMQEYHVTASGRTFALDQPFFVLATQNPIELEGTYPLPEAQLDRFMFNIVMTYLAEDEEVRVVTQTTGATTPTLSRVMSGTDILEIQSLVREVVVAEEVARYAVRLVDASRPGRQSDLQFVREWVKWGAGLRASQSLILAGKARALIHGRYHVSVADIQALARPVLRHRIIPNFYAESERITPDNLIERLLEAVPLPRSGM